jgi:hypothetical protein
MTRDDQQRTKIELEKLREGARRAKAEMPHEIEVEFAVPMRERPASVRLRAIGSRTLMDPSKAAATR